MHEIQHTDLFAGNWKSYLDQLRQMPMPARHLPTDGASIAAQIISSRL
jgi:hypothetical protein